MKKGFFLSLFLVLFACPSVEHIRGSEEGPIYVGVAWPFSTKMDHFRKGVQLAIDDINQKGGVLGRKIQPVYEDDGGSVTTGKAVAQRFSENPNIVGVIGHYHSYVAIPVSVTYEYYGVLMITPGATNPNLTDHGFRYVFRTIPSDTQVGTQLVDLAKKQDYERMVIIYEQSNYGRQLANAIEFRAEELGIHISDRLSYDSTVRDYRFLLSKLRLLEYEAVFFAGLGRDAQPIIRECRRVGLEMPFLGGNGMDTASLFEPNPKDVEGTLVLSVFHIDDPNPYVQFFNLHFYDAFKHKPDAWAAQGFDAIKLFAHAVKKAQSIQPAKVAEALRSTRDWYGVTGSHGFDARGEVQDKPMVTKIAEDGRLNFFSP